MLEFFFQIIVVFVSLIWIILHCYYADSTTDRMEEISYKIYDSKWFELPVHLQKLSTLVIIRSQGLFRFNGLKIVYCTLETLGKVCHLSNFIDCITFLTAAYQCIFI